MRYDNLKLEKGMYGITGKSFSQVLEELDPSENYRNTPLEGLDAFERQLKRFDIKVAGTKSDPVEKFFSTSTSAALFPEYVKRAVENGTRNQEILNQIIASKTYIDSMDYRSITSGAAEDAKELKAVAEGAEIPVTEVKTKENLVKLYKRGRMLVASYEAIRFQKLDLFTVTLNQIGAQIAKQQLRDAVNVLVKGDGNDNPAESVALTGETFAYADLINLWNRFEDYEMNTLLADANAMVKLLELEEFKNPNTGLNFQATGRLATPLGANLYKSSVVPANTLVALDKNCALEMVTAGDVMVEYDKLIDRQLERAAITSIAGFAKIFADASKVMTTSK
ncbi:MAG: phage major capsid protein [Massiliimalia sp.]|jgi:hypothetical protein